MGASSTNPSTATKRTGPSDLPPSIVTPQIHDPKLWNTCGETLVLGLGVRARVRRSKAASSAAPPQPLQESYEIEAQDKLLPHILPEPTLRERHSPAPC